MRILLVSRAFPYDASRSVYGVFKRLRMFVDAMKGLGEIDMLCYVRPDTDISPKAVAEAQARLVRDWDAPIHLALSREQPDPIGNTRWHIYGRPSLSYYHQTAGRPVSGRIQMEAFRVSLERRPDAILAHRLSAMCPVLRANTPLPPVFFDLDDIEHLSYIRGLRQLPQWRGRKLYYLQLPALMLAERRSIRLATRTFVCSDRDRRHLEMLYRLPRIVTVPNAVSLPCRPATAETKTCLFLGRYTYAPNVEAAALLLKEIWPRIRASVPEARLLIAGEGSEVIPRPPTVDPAVEFLGFVPDLDRLYARIQVVCTPILSGSGTRIKIIEAAAFGRPVVSTTLGAEGLQFRDGVEILLRDTPATFAAACIDLLRNPAMAERIALSGRSVVERFYVRAAVVDRVRDELRGAIANYPAHLPLPS